MTAGRLLVGVQGQVRQQGLRARRRERDGRPVTRDQRERTKEPQLRRRAGCGRRRSCRSRASATGASLARQPNTRSPRSGLCLDRPPPMLPAKGPRGSTRCVQGRPDPSGSTRVRRRAPAVERRHRPPSCPDRPLRRRRRCRRRARCRGAARAAGVGPQRGAQRVGIGVVEGGVVIDLAAMRSLMVDPERSSISVQPGAVWADFDAATQVHGLAAPAGVVSRTGVAGLAVGGGFGWLSRRWGLTSDNVVAMDILLGDGRCVRASADEHPDLFWAVCGGGGNFGIVTRFVIGLHHLGHRGAGRPAAVPGRPGTRGPAPAIARSSPARHGSCRCTP